MDKRGTLIALNPEEMRRAMLSTIARKLDAGVDATVLGQWRLIVLSCTATLHMHAPEEIGLQAAMQLREHIAEGPRDGEPYFAPMHL